MTSKKRVTTSSLRLMKERREPIVMVTAYDYPSAKLAEEADLDMILVGDSLGMVVLGYETTLPVTVEEMLHHTKAVTRGARDTFVVTDLPFLSYHGDWQRTLDNAGRIMQEGLAKAIKMEGGQELAATIERCVLAGIPIMGHLGLTPQSVHQLGGYKVQGREPEQAKKLVEDAKALEQAGAFSLVLECVPEPLAEYISGQISIPTIGIGAGRGCDGQVLVFHDILQYASSVAAKFVKPYANVGEQIRLALGQYANEVRERQFPEVKHTFTMNEDLLLQLYGAGVKK